MKHTQESPKARKPYSTMTFDVSSTADSDFSETLPGFLPVSGGSSIDMPGDVKHAGFGTQLDLLNLGASGHDGKLQDTSMDPAESSGRGGVVRKGQGYRRLWQAVTKVQRGQRLTEGNSDWQDCTVEDLIKIVQSLPASASAVKAVSPGLAYLDSRAAAALFKGLAKSGLGHRAVELFDYLRWAVGCFTCTACMH